jgi:hypothetical protein
MNGLKMLAGGEGFEPPHTGSKSPCLTTWRSPTYALNDGMI